MIYILVPAVCSSLPSVYKWMSCSLLFEAYELHRHYWKHSALFLCLYFIHDLFLMKPEKLNLCWIKFFSVL